MAGCLWEPRGQGGQAAARVSKLVDNPLARRVGRPVWFISPEGASGTNRPAAQVLASAPGPSGYRLRSPDRRQDHPVKDSIFGSMSGRIGQRHRSSDRAAAVEADHGSFGRFRVPGSGAPAIPGRGISADPHGERPAEPTAPAAVVPVRFGRLWASSVGSASSPRQRFQVAGGLRHTAVRWSPRRIDNRIPRPSPGAPPHPSSAKPLRPASTTTLVHTHIACDVDNQPRNRVPSSNLVDKALARGAPRRLT